MGSSLEGIFGNETAHQAAQYYQYSKKAFSDATENVVNVTAGVFNSTANTTAEWGGRVVDNVLNELPGWTDYFVFGRKGFVVTTVLIIFLLWRKAATVRTNINFNGIPHGYGYTSINPATGMPFTVSPSPTITLDDLIMLPEASELRKAIIAAGTKAYCEAGDKTYEELDSQSRSQYIYFSELKVYIPIEVWRDIFKKYNLGLLESGYKLCLNPLERSRSHELSYV